MYNIYIHVGNGKIIEATMLCGAFHKGSLSLDVIKSPFRESFRIALDYGLGVSAQNPNPNLKP